VVSVGNSRQRAVPTIVPETCQPGARDSRPLSERKQFVSTGHRIPFHRRVIATPILGGFTMNITWRKEAA